MSPLPLRFTSCLVAVALAVALLVSTPSQASDHGLTLPGTVEFTLSTPGESMPRGLSIRAVANIDGEHVEKAVPSCLGCQQAFIGPMPPGLYDIVIESLSTERHIIKQVRVASNAATKIGRIALKPHGTMSGTIRDAQGAPVPNATVSGFGQTNSAQAGRFTTQTNSDGFYSSGLTVADDYRIVVQRPDSTMAADLVNGDGDPARPTVSLSYGEHRTGVDLQFKEGGSVAGRILDSDGTPLYPAAATFYEKDANGTWNYSLRLPRLAIQPDGTFEKHQVPPGTYRMRVVIDPASAQHEGLTEFYPGTHSVSDAQDIVVSAGQTVALEHQASQGSSIRGRAVDPDGEPLPGVKILVYSTTSLAQLAPAPIETTSDDSGDFAVTGLVAGQYVVYATHENTFGWYGTNGLEPSNLSVESGTAHAVGEITVGGRSAVRGTVRDASGSSAPRSAVSACVTHFLCTALENTDAEGQFTFSGLPRGTFTLRALESTHHTEVSRDVHLDQHGTSEANLTFAALPSLAFTVAPGVAGQPIVGSELRAYRGESLATGARSSIQWLLDGKPFDHHGGNGTSAPEQLIVEPRFVGGRIAARVTLTRHGEKVTYTTPDRKIAGPAKFDSDRPRLSRKNTVIGERLTVARPIISPIPDRHTWRWYRDGEPIRGATSSAYRVTKADLGHQLTARLTPYLRGLKGNSTTSLPTTKVTRPVLSTRVRAGSRSRQRVRLTITAAVGSRDISTKGARWQVRVYRKQRGKDLVYSKDLGGTFARVMLTKQPRSKQTYYVKLIDKSGTFKPSVSEEHRVTIR